MKKENKPKYVYNKDILETTPLEINSIICPVSLDTFYPQIKITSMIQKKYPEATTMYNHEAEKRKLQLGEIFFYKEKSRLILFLPVKNRFTDTMSNKIIEKGLQNLIQILPTVKGIESIGIPEFISSKYNPDEPKWEDIKYVITKVIKEADLRYKFTIYETLR